MSGVYKNIEKYRILNRISKMDFYTLIGLTSTGYAAMVKNNTIKLSTLMIIAEKLNVSLADLLKDEIKTSLGNLRQDENKTAKPEPAYAINPLLLEPEVITSITRLPINDQEKMTLINDKVNLMQLHLKILLEKNGQLERQVEKFQEEIDRLVQ
jgi:DNA-binding Xre family transcriptional regulator